MSLDDTVNYLCHLRLAGRVVDALPETLMPPDLDAAYRAQDRLVEHLCSAWDGQPFGYKVALTNVAAQTMLGVPHPVFGQLISSRCFASGVHLAAEAFVVRIIECEIGFQMRADVPPSREPYTRETIRPYVKAMVPAVELVEHHFGGISHVTAQSLAADNAIHGAWIRGEPIEHWPSVDASAIETALVVNGETRLRGSGARVLGHPLEVVAWLANALSGRGRQLRAEDWITTGVTTDEVYYADRHDQLTARFEAQDRALGEVRLTFD